MIDSIQIWVNSCEWMRLNVLWNKFAHKVNFRQLTMSHEETYYLTGKKYLFSVNILNYDNDGMKRHNTDVDERDIVNTLEE